MREGNFPCQRVLMERELFSATVKVLAQRGKLADPNPKRVVIEVFCLTGSSYTIHMDDIQAIS